MSNRYFTDESLAALADEIKSKQDTLVGDSKEIVGFDDSGKMVARSMPYFSSKREIMSEEMPEDLYFGDDWDEILEFGGLIYGAEWDGSASTAWVRTDSAVMLAEPVPAVAGGTGSSPFDNIYPWNGMVRVTDPNAGEVVAIPKFYFKWSVPASGTGLKLQISEKPFDGSHISPAHADRGDGKGERDVVYIGRYHSDSTYKSVSGSMPVNNITREMARNSISALGNSVWQWDMAMRTTIQMLYLVEFADWNSQAKIGHGCGDNNYCTNVGYTDSMQYHTGTMCATREEYGYGTQYRYIEGLWDNVLDFLDGGYNDTNGMNVIMNPNEFSDSAGGTVIMAAPEEGWIECNPSAWEISNINGMEWAIYPSGFEGSFEFNDHTADYWDFYVGYPVWVVGGCFFQSPYCGMFFANCDFASVAGDNVGCRLQILP